MQKLDKIEILFSWGKRFNTNSTNLFRLEKSAWSRAWNWSKMNPKQMLELILIPYWTWFMSHDTFSMDADRAVLAASMIYFSYWNISILERHFSDIYKIQMYKVYIFKYKCCRRTISSWGSLKNSWKSLSSRLMYES